MNTALQANVNHGLAGSSITHANHMSETPRPRLATVSSVGVHPFAYTIEDVVLQDHSAHAYCPAHLYPLVRMMSRTRWRLFCSIGVRMAQLL